MEKLEFKTEIKQLLDLVIHSLYSHKDIFLRELISNAADAIDKLRFAALTEQNLNDGDTDWKIKITPDSKNGTLTISDNGLGMSHQELIDNLGTIAKSGTKEFLSQLKAGQLDLIGQFGVGFYASFMVADKVRVISRKAGTTEAFCWESAGIGGFTVNPADRAQHGTDVILHLQKDQLNYLQEWELRKIIKKYSDFVEHPIVMDVEHEETDTKDEKKTKKITKEEILNSRKALWTKAKKEVTEEEYKEFYKQLAHDYQDPFETIHYSAEGSSEFKALLYIPGKAPQDIYWRESLKGLHLYIKRIFIMDDCKQLVPEYLRFLRGVVEASDLPLNVSREILQQDAQLEKIRKNIVKKILSTLQNLKNKEPERYLKFFQQFGPLLKEGVPSDYENKDALQELLLFQSTTTEPGKYHTLAEYVEKMPPDQKNIYYLLAPDRSTAMASPHLEIFRQKKFEVLLLTDPIDEWLVGSLFEYQKKTLQAVDREQLELNEDDKQKADTKKDQAELGSLVSYLKTLLADKVQEVKFSSRLTDSASCLVGSAQELPENMRRMMESMGQTVPETKKNLEINAHHPLLKSLNNIYANNSQDPRLADYGQLLYEQALLSSGHKLSDPAGFNRRLNELLIKALG